MRTDSVSALATVYWQQLTATDPLHAITSGEPIESIGLLDQRSIEERAATAGGLLERLDALTVAEAEADLAAVLRHFLWTATTDPQTAGYLDPSAPYQTFGAISFPARLAIAAATGETRERLLPAFAARVRSVADRIVEQRRRGTTLPRPAVDGAVATWDALGAQLHELFGDDGIDAAAAEVRTQIGIAAESASDQVGMARLPGGEDAYRLLVQRETTLGMDAEELHRLGLQQCAELTERMAELRAKLGGPADEEQARAWVEGQARFYARDPDEVATVFRRHIAQVEPELARLFRTLPRAPYDVAPLDPESEAGMTFGHYQPPTSAEPRGLYRYNCSRLDQRSLLTAAALILHELVPGHHFQIAAQAENQDLHPLQQHTMELGAFQEGWAEYASHLGWELGTYDDDWDAYGRLSHERFTAQRLAVDTGINLGYWDLDQARSFMRANTFESDTQIASEVLRYGTDMPAQSLAYRAGFLAFDEARRAADGTDLQLVHEAMLAGGAVPLPRMQERVAAL